MTGPQAGVPVPDNADRLPTRPTYSQPTMWWLGAHGGAGESTLAGLASRTQAADHAWPVPAQRGTLARVVLVARTNRAGLAAAQRAAREWASGVLGDDVRLEGLVLVADAAGRLPRELRDYVHLVSGGVPRTWSLPWMGKWRTGEPDPHDLPREYLRLFTDLSLSPVHS
ncbi:MAG: hypothetical protein KF727_14180 [Microbacteriaceae bacterium]|nr:hypothetical protein [Microbacteriaceae bacterium]